jgi:hypothetical protein
MRSEPIRFSDEAMAAFRFLVDEHGFGEPAYHDRLIPAVTYHRPGLRVAVFWHGDHRDADGYRISVTVSAEPGPLRAELDRLVEAAVLAPRHRVAHRAHKVSALRASLADNALWLGRLLPMLRDPAATDLFREAETNRRRPRNTAWRYP